MKVNINDAIGSIQVGDLVTFEKRNLNDLKDYDYRLIGRSHTHETTTYYLIKPSTCEVTTVRSDMSLNQFVSEYKLVLVAKRNDLELVLNNYPSQRE